MTENLKMQDLIKTVVASWVEVGKYVVPDLQDGAGWICTEAGEALDETLRMKAQYVRNNPRSFAMDKFMEELADVVIMSYVTATAAEQDLDSFIKAKLNKMNVAKMGRGLE